MAERYHYRAHWSVERIVVGTFADHSVAMACPSADRLVNVELAACQALLGPVVVACSELVAVAVTAEMAERGVDQPQVAVRLVQRLVAMSRPAAH